MHRNRLLARVGVSAALAVALLAPASATSSAQAQQLPLQCVGSAHATYEPPMGLTLRETTVSLHETFTCADALVLNGYADVTFSQEVSCLVPSPEDTATTVVVVYYFKLSHGGVTQSIVEYTNTVVTHPLGQTVVTATGLVTGGYREGAPAIATNVRVNPNLVACLLHGIGSDTGTFTLTIG